MKSEIVEKLNNVNLEFYGKIAPYFDSTRNYFWEGWDEILPSLNQESSIKVLDVGCGNGRFGLYLQEKLPNFAGKNYVGIDFDPFLLGKAQFNLPHSTFFHTDLLNISSLTSLDPKQEFDLIALFGVLHHIPSYEKRLELLKNLKPLLTSAGKLFFSTWEFTKAPNFPKNTVSWDELGINPAEIENGDYLLTWSKGTSATRYCHYISQEEAGQLCQDAGLKIDKSYLSASKGDEFNRYLIASV